MLSNWYVSLCLAALELEGACKRPIRTDADVAEQDTLRGYHMKHCSIAFLIVCLTVTGCADGFQPPTPDSGNGVEQTSSPTDATAPTGITVESFSTTTRAPGSSPTTTRSPAPNGTPTDSIWPVCTATPIPEATVAPRPLRFVYLKDGEIWLWKEETAHVNVIPAQGHPVGISVSSDGTLVAYRDRASDQESMIRVVDVDGERDRILAIANTSEVPQRYPSSPQYYVPTFGWVPDTHLVYYSYQRTCCGEGDDTLEVTRFIDADTGTLRFTLAGGEVDTIRYAPGGRQMAALTASELRLIDMNNGRVMHSYPVESYRVRVLSMSYSPDGRWLIAATKPGFTVIDTQSGDRRDIPFEYQPYGMGSWLLYPQIDWLANGPVFYTVFSVDSRERLFSEQTSNTVWRINVEDGTVVSVYEFRGGVWLAQLSPDRAKLLYRRSGGQGALDLYVADLLAGRELLYDTGTGINLSAWGWAPDSLRFTYLYSLSGEVRLGSICAAPVSLRSASGGISFLDADRYLTLEQVGELQRASVFSLSGQQKTIVDLVGLAADKDPPYDSYGPLYGYFLGD